MGTVWVGLTNNLIFKNAKNMGTLVFEDFDPQNDSNGGTALTYGLFAKLRVSE